MKATHKHVYKEESGVQEIPFTAEESTKKEAEWSANDAKVLTEKVKNDAQDTLAGTDEDLALIMEDVLTILKTSHNIDIEDSLTTESKAKLKSRRDARAVLK